MSQTSQNTGFPMESIASTESSAAVESSAAAGISEFSARSSGVTLTDITKIFSTPGGTGETVAVNHINLEVANGELVTLLGPSGCGKTTTLRMISGFEYPSSGQIMIGGRDVANVPPNKRGVSMVFQSYALFPHLSVWDNIAYGLKVKKLPRQEVLARTGKVIALMQLEGMERRFPNQLSGGQQQRVSLARAIVIEPSVLLFDEPLSNLDAKLREHMRDELRSLQKRLGITSLYVTHDQGEAMAISDRVVIMKDGDLIQVGSPQEIYEYPNCKFVANFIGKANFISGVFQGMEGKGAKVTIGNQVTLGGQATMGDGVTRGEHRLLIPNPGAMKGVQNGNACSLALRPESASLASGDNAQGIPGQVLRATYFGSKVEYEVETAPATLVIEGYNPQRSACFTEGDKVKVVLDLDCVRVLVDEELVIE